MNFYSSSLNATDHIHRQTALGPTIEFNRGPHFAAPDVRLQRFASKS